MTLWLHLFAGFIVKEEVVLSLCLVNNKFKSFCDCDALLLSIGCIVSCKVNTVVF